MSTTVLRRPGPVTAIRNGNNRTPDCDSRRSFSEINRRIGGLRKKKQFFFRSGKSIHPVFIVQTDGRTDGRTDRQTRTRRQTHHVGDNENTRCRMLCRFFFFFIVPIITLMSQYVCVRNNILESIHRMRICGNDESGESSRTSARLGAPGLYFFILRSS